MNQIELEKIADHFDRDHDGYIDLGEINSILRGIRRARSLAKRHPLSDSEKIDHEIQHQVSHCSCSKRFKVLRVAEGQYRFGDSQKLRLVRILRSTVMVRVGGGWEPLEEFLRKHDPCRASGRTNTALRGMDPGLTTATFGTKAQTAISNKNVELIREAHNAGDNLTVSDTSGRRHAVVTKRTTTTVTKSLGSKSSRETTPTRTLGATVRSEPLKHTLVRQASPKAKSGSPSRSKTPSRAMSPGGDVRKSESRSSTAATSTTPSHIPKPARRPISPVSTAHTATGLGPKPSGIPTPSKSKIPKNISRTK
jgi:dystonin